MSMDIMNVNVNVNVSRDGNGEFNDIFNIY